MPSRRILSLWFPRLAAERVLRGAAGLAGQPLAVVAEARGALVLASLGAVAEAKGLRRGMALGDARAICPGLVTRPEDLWREAAFLDALRRWAGRFSPWVAPEGREGRVFHDDIMQAAPYAMSSGSAGSGITWSASSTA